ncbi:POP1 [Candida margitis]|uniref:POP1 n=1 Tax=Candida margitis TaxID=1775924 RepID=UPI0022266996|nr:POP1 [Candida margitis]KAI5967717.1 POP1 [Candida margitis]
MSNQQRNDKKSSLNKKKTKLYNSRNIKAQNQDASYDQQDTKLNVPEFIESRKYEINAFELSQLKSKQALNSRCFQNLPRSMRRRAASHHISRIPKRLRSKALREMKGAKTPSGKVPKGRRLYKLLQKQKTLKVASKLKKERCNPGEIWTKCNIRAHHKEIADELQQLWKSREKKLNNSVGSFDHSASFCIARPPRRSIKYGKRQQKFAWIPSHIWHAKRFKMSKKFDFQVPYTPTQKCFKFMNRQNKYRAVCFDTSYRGSLSLNWVSEDSLYQFLRALLNKTYVPGLVMNGNRSYTGVMYIQGKPSAFGTIFISRETRCMLLQIQTENYGEFLRKLREYILAAGLRLDFCDCRYSLGSIDLSGPSSLEYLSKVLHLRDASAEVMNIWASISSHRDNSLIPVGTTLTFEIYDPRLWSKPTKFPIKSTQDIYDTVVQLNNERVTSDVTIASLLSSEGRYASYENQLSIKDLGRIQSHGTPFEKVSHSKIPLLLTKTAPQTWSLICPWFWTLPIWIQLVKIPGIKPGGLKQMYQFNFENHNPTYPYDYPWSDEGQKYNCMIGDLSRDTDAKKPKKQMSLQKAEERFSTLYDAYTCDWYNLRNARNTLSKIESEWHQYWDADNRIHPDAFANELASTVFENRADDKHKSVVRLMTPSNYNSNVAMLGDYRVRDLPVTPIALKILGEGVIENNARIYENKVCKDEHVVGFVTTGGFNLNEGKCTGVGAVFFTNNMSKKPKDPIFVRNPGKELMYACEYECIKQ